jgi:hypothetical protein
MLGFPAEYGKTWGKGIVEMQPTKLKTVRRAKAIVIVAVVATVAVIVFCAVALRDIDLRFR